MMHFILRLVLCCMFGGFGMSFSHAGTVHYVNFESEILKNTKVGINPNREILVITPEGYEESKTKYPVIYFLHSFIFDDPRKLMADWQIASLLDNVIAGGEIQPFIMVMPDYSTEFVGSLFQNNEVSGRWIDFTANEVVAFIDSQYRTIAHKSSRLLSGHFMGGRGALATAMLYPDVFTNVYAFHPVATDTGYVAMHSRPNWPLVHAATSYAEISKDLATQIFVSISQGFAPNPNRPPFYADFLVEKVGSEYQVDINHTRRIHEGFLLDEWVPKYAEVLRGLNAIKFDWGRYDSNQDHIHGNQAFSRLLNEYGIAHEAEEYNGDQYRQVWGENGRFYTDLIPFMRRHIEF